MTRYKYQLLVIAASFVLLGILYLFPNKPKHVAETIPADAHSAGMVAYVDIVNAEKKALGEKNQDLAKTLQVLEAKLSDTVPEKEKVILIDSLSRLCLYASPLLSADYCFQKSQISHQAIDMLKAGDFFMRAAELVESNAHQAIINKAIESLEGANAIDSSNADIKVSLASAYVESGSNPMKGIMLLREVAAKHPDNIAAQYNLGLFSIKSRQFDKAVSRFNKVLELDSTYYQAYFYLGQCALELGNKQEAIEKFKHYQYLCTDSIEKQNIHQYINKLLTT